MGSFSCDMCNDTVKKAKVKIHIKSCYTSSISCIDCGVGFNLQTYNSHNQCMTEKKKYAGELAQERINKQQDISVIEHERVEPAKIVKPVEIIDLEVAKEDNDPDPKLLSRIAKHLKKDKKKKSKKSDRVVEINKKAKKSRNK
eukprot:NODE_560_length_6681_cov_0.715740.p4 type:complete len:143 gc:universal NODE_560_length_6681_cov_0.715740:3437-3865(+)